ncbi:hypothetical protein AB9E26_35705, partial [Rhizobium leguminosarum]
MNPINPRYGAFAGSQALFDEGLLQHMLRVYNYMALGLVITGLVEEGLGAGDGTVAGIDRVHADLLG